jgi:hypothetical protein
MRAAIRNSQARRNARQSFVARRLMLHGTVELKPDLYANRHCCSRQLIAKWIMHRLNAHSRVAQLHELDGLAKPCSYMSRIVYSCEPTIRGGRSQLMLGAESIVARVSRRARAKLHVGPEPGWYALYISLGPAGARHLARNRFRRVEIASFDIDMPCRCADWRCCSGQHIAERLGGLRDAAARDRLAERCRSFGLRG